MKMASQDVDPMNVSALSAALGGNLLVPGDSGYDETRSMWNARFDRRPDFVALCTSAEDVKAAIDFARTNGLGLSVKGGGHSYAALSVADGGLLIDLSQMKSVDVDIEERTVSVGPGVSCGEMDLATQHHGLATPTPTVSSVGVIGAALGGGAGYLSRRFGLTLDNIVAAELVTADGRIVGASAEENPDLFWAIRGGGGNFGVVTRLVLRLHEVGPGVLAGQIVYPFDDAVSLLRSYRDFMMAAPGEFQCYAFCFRVPPIDVFPEETHGHPVLDFVLCHQDPEADDFVQPLRELGKPILDFVGTSSYVETQQAFDANLPNGQRYLSKAHDLDALSDGAIHTMVEFVPRMSGALTAAYFDPLGRAIEEVHPSATAYSGRETEFGFHIIAGWLEPDEDQSVIEWAGDFHAAMGGHANGGVYVNLIADDEADRIPDAYGANYERLRDLKARWDPSNLFNSNYNIPPA
jgi:FAD/FMN-containing dehydrogenase